MKYNIGTRGSLLALTQCQQVKEILEKELGDQFTLNIITTQGDQIQDKPLWQIDGKDFFTKELDHALLAREIDLVVHSYKDLGTERPEGIKTAALLERNFPHDVLLIKKSTIENLNRMDKFIVGTSSPRRIAAINSHLKKLIPNGNSLEMECQVLRGNVNTRIEKLLNDQYDAIVLALAGLERLAMDEKASKEVSRLITDLNFMILPLSLFPTAAGQGTLAIECRSDDYELLEKLKKINHQSTAHCAALEKQRFKSYGGGCHLGVGIHAYQIDGIFGLIESGEHQGKKIHVQNLLEHLPSRPEGSVFIGMPSSKSRWEDIPSDDLIEKVKIDFEMPKDEGHLFVTSSYTTDAALKIKRKTLWTSGVRTSKRMVLEGSWVNGMGDLFGEKELARFKQSHFVKLFHSDIQNDWIVLTNDLSQSDLGKTVAVYSRKIAEPTSDQIELLKSVGAFYWTSYFQYITYLEKFPFIKEKMHCCGLGKTYFQFQANKIKVTPFANIDHFEKWFTQGHMESGND